MVSAFVEPTPGGPRLQMHRDSKQSWHLYLSRLPGVALLLTAVRAEVMNTATPEDRETWKEAGILDDVTRIVKSKHAQRDDNVVNLTLDWVSYVQVDCRVHPLCADPDGLHSHPRRIAIYGSGVRELKGCAGSTDAAVEAFGPESGRVYHDACVQWLTTGELGLLLHVSPVEDAPPPTKDILEPMPGGPRIHMAKCGVLFLSMRLPTITPLLKTMTGKATRAETQGWKEAGILNDVERIITSEHVSQAAPGACVELKALSYRKADGHPVSLMHGTGQIAITKDNKVYVRGKGVDRKEALRTFGPASGHGCHDARLNWLSDGSGLGLTLYISPDPVTQSEDGDDSELTLTRASTDVDVRLILNLGARQAPPQRASVAGNSMLTADAAAALMGMGGGASAARAALGKRVATFESLMEEKLAHQETKRRHLSEQLMSAHVQARAAAQRAEEAAEAAQHMAATEQRAQAVAQEKVALVQRLQEVAKQKAAEAEAAQQEAQQAVAQEEQAANYLRHMRAGGRQVEEVRERAVATAKEKLAQADSAEQELRAQAAKVELMQRAMDAFID